MSDRGRFITLEGIDGAGKSSHLDFLCQLVREKGHGVEKTFEPGGTAFGNKLREAVLHHPASALGEALAMFAARSAHLESVIRPALNAGTWIVCDRFSDSTYAYQCGGRGLARDQVVTLERMVHPELQPDATFLFDIDPAIAYERQRAQSRAPDVFESERADFFVRVRDAYLDRARQHAQRFHVIDSSGEPGQVRSRVAEAFAQAFA